MDRSKATASITVDSPVTPEPSKAKGQRADPSAPSAPDLNAAQAHQPYIPQDVLYTVAGFVGAFTDDDAYRFTDKSRRYGYAPCILHTLKSLRLTSRAWNDAATTKMYENIVLRSASSVSTFYSVLEECNGERVAHIRRFMLSVSWNDCVEAGIQGWMLTTLFSWFGDYGTCQCVSLPPDVFLEQGIPEQFTTWVHGLHELLIVERTNTFHLHRKGSVRRISAMTAALPTSSILQANPQLRRLALPRIQIDLKLVKELRKLTNLRCLCLDVPSDSSPPETRTAVSSLLSSKELGHIKRFVFLHKGDFKHLDVIYPLIDSARDRGVVVKVLYEQEFLTQCDGEFWDLSELSLRRWNNPLYDPNPQ